MGESLAGYGWAVVGLLILYLIAALLPLLVWWLCRFQIWIGLKILLGILAVPPTAVFLFWVLYFSVAGALAAPIVWIIFGLLLWGAFRLLSGYPGSVDVVRVPPGVLLAVWALNLSLTLLTELPIALAIAWIPVGVAVYVAGRVTERRLKP